MWNLWRRLRLRTKVLVVVGFLIVVGALSPDEGQDATAEGRQPSGQEERGTSEAGAGETTGGASGAEDETEEVAEEEQAVDTVTVPALRAQPVQDARRALRKAGLAVEVVRQASWQPMGTVLKQGAKPGTDLSPGGVVTLVVAAPMPRVPGVVGQVAGAGRTALTRAGFKVSIVTKEVPAGQNNVVLSQSPAGTQQAAPGSAVQLVISKLVQPVAPPANNCTAGYRPCLPPASDYDCAGGSGDGPQYATGPIYVSGSDPYDLDSEGDGIACEA